MISNSVDQLWLCAHWHNDCQKCSELVPSILFGVEGLNKLDMHISMLGYVKKHIVLIFCGRWSENVLGPNFRLIRSYYSHSDRLMHIVVCRPFWRPVFTVLGVEGGRCTLRQIQRSEFSARLIGLGFRSHAALRGCPVSSAVAWAEQVRASA